MKRFGLVCLMISAFIVSNEANTFSDKSECLSKDVLTSLGFTDALDEPADNTAADATCKFFH